MNPNYFNANNIDAREIADCIQEEVITTSITSPPYFDMKDYGHANQIGFGQTYQQYLEDLKSVFLNIYKITKRDGTLWIIIDTFKDKHGVTLLPFDLTSKLKEIGWIIQDIFIWKKDKTVPWSSRGFAQRKFEYILFFSKSNKYKYNRDRVRVYDTSLLKRWWIRYPERYNPKGKAIDEVWEYPIPTQGSWGKEYIKHFCPLPMDMIGNMIQLTTDEGDIVLDPFSGSGSVLVQAAYMKRKYIGFEINRNYIDMFNNYLERTLVSGQKKYLLSQLNSSTQDEFQDLILKLRYLKYARVLHDRINKYCDNNYIKYIFVEEIGKSQERHKLRKVQYTIIFDPAPVNSDEFKNMITNIISIPPLSKFGIEPIFAYGDNLDRIDPYRVFYGYTSSNTHNTLGQIDMSNMFPRALVISDIKLTINENDYD